ncbi:MAG: DUF6600 domain-containing protein [Bacteroidota bacterium]
MKNIQSFLLMIFTVLSLSFSTEIKAQNISVNFSQFQRELSPHGRWINNPRFGHVWIYNTPGFRPYYSNGHWEYTNYGWSWVSDFAWGWAPFHYGRWEYDPFDGWMWIPGYEWGSSWVSWSYYDGYYGWAPLGYGGGINSPFNSIPYNYWTFIPRTNICDRNVNRYYVAPEQNTRFKNAVIINNVYEGKGQDGRFYRGPERNEVERYTKNKIEERIIDDKERSGEIKRPARQSFADRTKTTVEQPVKTETIQKPVAPVNNERFLDRRKNNENTIPVDEPKKVEVKKPANVQNETPQRSFERVPQNKQIEVKRQYQPQTIPNNNRQIERPSVQERIQSKPAAVQNNQRTYQTQQPSTRQPNMIRQQRMSRN